MPSPPGRADLRTPAWVAGPGSSMSGETGSAQAALAASPRPGHMLAHKPAPASQYIIHQCLVYQHKTLAQ